MKIILNEHYVKRKMSGVGRYARQIQNALMSSEFNIDSNVPPDWFYKDGIASRYMRFFAVAFYEAIIAPIKIFLSNNVVHISPAFSAPIYWGRSKSIIVFHDLAFFDYPECYSMKELTYFKVNLFLIKWLKHHVVTPSEFVKEEIISRVGIDSSHVTVISPYSDLKYQKNKYESKDNYLLLLSNAHPRKNIVNTIKGFLMSEYANSGFTLKVVGTFEVDLTDLTSEGVELIKNVENNLLANLYKNSECVLLFSYSEGFGFPVVEAAGFDVPTLSSDVTSLMEFLPYNQKKEVALTPEEIKKKLNKYKQDEKYRKLMVENCTSINQKYSEKQFVFEWVKLINYVLR